MNIQLIKVCSDEVLIYRYAELASSLPPEVKSDRYCNQLLRKLQVLADYMATIGPMKMSKEKLIQVLATLAPWELEAPDVEGAIKVSKYQI